MYRVTHYRNYYLTFERELPTLKSVNEYLEYVHRVHGFSASKIEIWVFDTWERVRIFRDTENGNLFDSYTLLKEFNELPTDERESVGFYAWLKNCTSKNGFLEEIN